MDRLELKDHQVSPDEMADVDAEGSLEKSENQDWRVSAGQTEKTAFLDLRVVLVVLVQQEKTERMDKPVLQEFPDRAGRLESQAAWGSEEYVAIQEIQD